MLTLLVQHEGQAKQSGQLIHRWATTNGYQDIIRGFELVEELGFWIFHDGVFLWFFGFSAVRFQTTINVTTLQEVT
jgi:hypothetical protein